MGMLFDVSCPYLNAQRTVKWMLSKMFEKLVLNRNGLESGLAFAPPSRPKCEFHSFTHRDNPFSFAFTNMHGEREQCQSESARVLVVKIVETHSELTYTLSRSLRLAVHSLLPYAFSWEVRN